MKLEVIKDSTFQVCSKCKEACCECPSDPYLDKLADLSIRINHMQSSLRTFEKERVNPRLEIIFEELVTLGQEISGLRTEIRKLKESFSRIEK